MLGYLKGKIIAKEGNVIILAVNGVGYEIHVGALLLQDAVLGNDFEVYTHFHVREDVQSLYGFASLAERQLFREFIGVNGVGPKTGLALLSAAPMNELIRAIQLEDHAVFQAVSGIGPKTAKRLVLELRSVFEDVEISIPDTALKSSVRADLLLALEQLGYSGKEVQNIIAGMNLNEMELEDAVREVLKRSNS